MQVAEAVVAVELAVAVVLAEAAVAADAVAEVARWVLKSCWASKQYNKEPLLLFSLYKTALTLKVGLRWAAMPP